MQIISVAQRRPTRERTIGCQQSAVASVCGRLSSVDRLAHPCEGLPDAEAAHNGRSPFCASAVRSPPNGRNATPIEAFKMKRRSKKPPSLSLSLVTVRKDRPFSIARVQYKDVRRHMLAYSNQEGALLLRVSSGGGGIPKERRVPT
uniref:Uncharacterized protein n=1 Tax=Trichuris muris TaxID=70415 RepID=A0A5S6QVT2_TRIMR